MDRDELITKLKSGWALTNRGTGWYAQAPRQPYERKHSIKIEDGIVDAMEKDGTITIEIPYQSANAYLTK
jgi:hypothetical protein